MQERMEQTGSTPIAGSQPEAETERTRGTMREALRRRMSLKTVAVLGCAAAYFAVYVPRAYDAGNGPTPTEFYNSAQPTHLLDSPAGDVKWILDLMTG